MRTRAALLFVVPLLALTACGSGGDGGGGAPADASSALEGTYSVEFSDPVVVESVGFLSTTASIVEEGGRLSLNLDYEVPDTDNSRGLSVGIGINDELEIQCLAPDDCFSFGGAGRFVFVDGEPAWEPEIALLEDEYFADCDVSLVPPPTVPLRDAVYEGDVLQSFTVDLARLVNESADGSGDPDLIAGGPCSVAALIELEMTATRVG